MNCAQCASDFAPRIHNALYCSSSCKHKAWRTKRGDVMRQQWRDYHHSEKGVLTKLLNYAHDRARAEGVAFDLDREWLKQKLDGKVCELTGLPYRNGSPGAAYR